MKSLVTLLCLTLASCGFSIRSSDKLQSAALPSKAGAIEQGFHGAWEGTDPRIPVKVTFLSDSITIGENGKRTVYRVVGGEGLLGGLLVKAGERETRATATCKFNQMILHLDERHFVLRKTGTQDLSAKGINMPGRAAPTKEDSE